MKEALMLMMRLEQRRRSEREDGIAERGRGNGDREVESSSEIYGRVLWSTD